MLSTNQVGHKFLVFTSECSNHFSIIPLVVIKKKTMKIQLILQFLISNIVNLRLIILVLFNRILIVILCASYGLFFLYDIFSLIVWYQIFYLHGVILLSLNQIFAIFFNVSDRINNDRLPRISNRYKSGPYDIKSSFVLYFLSTSFLALPSKVRNYYNSAIVVPQKVYKNADTDKLQTLKENKHKSGIYRWINQVNSKSYIGSSVNLEKRFRVYYSINALESSILRG